MPLGLAAAGCLFQYVKECQRSALPHIRAIIADSSATGVVLDAATRRNLELTQNLQGGVENTLASILDKSATPMGSRLLKRWIHFPLRDIDVLTNRQNAITDILTAAFVVYFTCQVVAYYILGYSRIRPEKLDSN